MKMRYLLAIAIATILSFQVLHAQGQYKHAISGDPLDLLISKVFNATYEHQLSAKNTFTVSASYYSYSDWWSAMGIGGSYRWYFPGLFNDGKNPIEGFSAGPMARVSFWSWDGPDTPYYDDYTGDVYIVIGGEAAYKWVFDGFVVEPIVRIGFGVTDITGLGYDAYGAGVNIGYAW
jgi:hypothetical protein